MPSIFGLDTNDAFQTNATGAWKWLWPVIFAGSFAPAAIMNVYGENVLKETSQSQLVNPATGQPYNTDRSLSIGDVAFETVEEAMFDPVTKNVNIWYYLFIQSIVQEITIVAFIWLDCVPHFGTQNNIHNTFNSIKQDWKWFFGMDGAGVDVPLRALVFIGCYTCMYFHYMLY